MACNVESRGLYYDGTNNNTNQGTIPENVPGVTTYGVFFNNGITNTINALWLKNVNSLSCLVWARSINITIADGSSNVVISNLIASADPAKIYNIEVPLGATVGKVIIDRNINSKKIINFTNNGSIQGSSGTYGVNGGDALVIERNALVINNGSIYGGGGHGGKGGQGQPSPNKVDSVAAYYGAWGSTSYSYRYDFNDRTWPKENTHKVYIAGSLYKSWGEKKGCDRCWGAIGTRIVTRGNYQIDVGSVCSRGCQWSRKLPIRSYVPPGRITILGKVGADGAIGGTGDGFQSPLNDGSPRIAGTRNSVVDINGTRHYGYTSGSGGYGGSGGSWGKTGNEGDYGLAWNSGNENTSSTRNYQRNLGISLGGYAIKGYGSFALAGSDSGLTLGNVI